MAKINSPPQQKLVHPYCGMQEINTERIRSDRIYVCVRVSMQQPHCLRWSEGRQSMAGCSYHRRSGEGGGGDRVSRHGGSSEGGEGWDNSGEMSQNFLPKKPI